MMRPDATLEPEEKEIDWSQVPAFVHIDYVDDRHRYDMEFTNWLLYTLRPDETLD